MKLSYISVLIIGLAITNVLAIKSIRRGENTLNKMDAMGRKIMAEVKAGNNCGNYFVESNININD